MCKFLSGVVTRSGDFFCDPEHTNSHEILIREAHLNDGEAGYFSGNLARFEFTPPNDLKTISDLSTWELRVDEGSIPEWWDAEKVRTYCERIVSPMLIKDARKTLIGGCWIFDGGKASLRELVRGRIAIAANGANLEGANLWSTNLVRANLVGANLAGANLAGTNLVRANLEGANLKGTNLVGANLEGANLKGTNLVGANLEGANLWSTNLKGANLAGANLAGANLVGANLWSTNLWGAQNVKLPAGWKISETGTVEKVI
jgi:hypothetical protein